MRQTADHAMRAELREQVERLVGRCDPSMPTSIVSAMQSFLTAMEYDDATLMRSSFETAFLDMAKAMNDSIQKRLRWPEQCRGALRRIWEQIKGHPLEDWDDVGATIESRFNELLKVLVDLRDGLVKLLQQHGYGVENAPQLDSDIKELEELRKRTLETWPWSNRELPAVDQEMLNASLAALKRGEKGERIEDLIARLGGTIDKP
jgi:hypothetical protein